MAKVQFDPIIQNMSRRAGNFVYSSWKGINVIKRYKKPVDIKSPKQLEVRNAFADAGRIWKSLPQKIKDSWNKSVIGLAMTPRNMFIKKNCAAIRNGNPGQISFKNGTDLPCLINAEAGEAGTIKITYKEKTAPFLNAVLIKINAETNKLEAPQFIYDFATSETQAEINELESSTEYYLYIIAAETSFDKCGQLSESAGYKIKVR